MRPWQRPPRPNGAGVRTTNKRDDIPGSMTRGERTLANRREHAAVQAECERAFAHEIWNAGRPDVLRASARSAGTTPGGMLARPEVQAALMRFRDEKSAFLTGNTTLDRRRASLAAVHAARAGRDPVALLQALRRLAIDLSGVL